MENYEEDYTILEETIKIDIRQYKQQMTSKSDKQKKKVDFVLNRLYR